MKRRHWISWILLAVAYATFGQLLHHSGMGQMAWMGCIAFVVAIAGMLTVFWQPTRQVLLLCFQSDTGYSIMVLATASLAVLVVVQVHTFAYLLVLVATSLLARVDSLVDHLGNRVAFLYLVGVPLLGLGISWVPTLVNRAIAQPRPPLL